MWLTDPDLLNHAQALARNTVTAAAILVVFWIASRIVAALVARFTNRAHASADLVQFLARSAKVALQVVGVVTALGSAGINVAALVAGLGLTGFALGFAFRDILSNLIAGVLLLIPNANLFTNPIMISRAG
jgi:small conductance mechanosensitive channel